MGEAQSNSQRPIHLPQTVKSRDLCTDLLQWIISTRGLHTAAPAYTRARGALQERGQVLLVSQERLRTVLCRTQPLSHIHEGFHGQRTYLTYESSSLGMELLLNRATISPYGHCGLTSTSWKKKNFPPHPLAGQLQQRNKNMQQLYKFKNFICKWSKLYSEYMVWWENSSSVQQNDGAGSSLGQTYSSKKDKKEKNLLGIQLLNIRNTASSNHNSLFYSN